MSQAIRLKHFIYGLSQIGVDYTLEFKTYRSSDTFALYNNSFRKFYEYLGIPNSPFHKKSISYRKSERGFKAHAKREQVVKYTLNDDSQQDKTKVPMYIKVEDMKRILEVIRRKYSIREEIIVRLMFECGLRIGETLGLTLEDITTTPEEIIYKEFDDIGKLIIRNRLSDKDYQLAKTLQKPKTEDDYKSSWYSKENTGFQVVKPTISLLRKLDNYINNIHGSMSKVKRNNYKQLLKADKVTLGKSVSTTDNYYIFMNKNGGCLTQDGWNKTLRKIFLEAGLGIDLEVRKHNLSHRFRHGFAMFHKKYQNATELDLMYALRHSSLDSVECYFRPDEDDIREANLKATESMYALIPELRLDD